MIGYYLVRQLLQRQRMAHALVANEAHFRLLAEQSSDMVTRIGLDNRLLYVSPSCARIIGWSPDELVGHVGRGRRPRGGQGTGRAGDCLR